MIKPDEMAHIWINPVRKHLRFSLVKNTEYNFDVVEVGLEETTLS